MDNESGKKQRLLIVDDSRVIRVTARKILQNHFETVEAVDGENAWEMLNDSEPFALVVSDLTMPNLDGYGLLERIRSSHLPQIKNIPVIIITGANDSESTKVRATQAGATDFIGKPFDSVHLLARTQAHASAHTKTQTLTKENFGLESQSQTDTLTGLPNEAAFMDHSYQQLSYAIRHNSSLAVFRVEIDDFGNLFKQHGKDLSESILKSVATVLQSGIRQEDMAARVGNARFALLLPGMNTAGIRNLAERINRDISARIIKQGENRIHYTVSIGVAAPEIRRDTRFDELLSSADGQLAYAMAQGGNQVVFEDPGHAPQAPCQQSSEKDTVPVMLDETINAMINQCVEADIQSEGINNTSAWTGVDVEEIMLDEVPAVDSLATREPDGLPGMFAGPVPELNISRAVNTSQSSSQTSTFTAHNKFPTDHSTVDEETIVITAPYDIFNSADETPTARQPIENTPDESSTQRNGVTTEDQTDTSRYSNIRDLTKLADATQPDEIDELVIIKRPGIFRRMRSKLAGLFRRRSRHSG